MPKKAKRSCVTGDARIAQKTRVVERERDDFVTSANRWLGIIILVCKGWWLLESLPWDKLHHLT